MHAVIPGSLHRVVRLRLLSWICIIGPSEVKALGQEDWNQDSKSRNPMSIKGLGKAEGTHSPEHKVF